MMPGKPLQAPAATVERLIYEVAVKAATSSLVQTLPFLSLPLVNPLFVGGMEAIAAAIYAELSRIVEFNVTEFETQEQQNQFEKAVTDLHKALSLRDKDAVQKATADFKATLRNLVRFTR